MPVMGFVLLSSCYRFYICRGNDRFPEKVGKLVFLSFFLSFYRVAREGGRLNFDLIETNAFGISYYFFFSPSLIRLKFFLINVNRALYACSQV